jgi:4'-phosphopantetheinyl transferase EntD
MLMVMSPTLSPLAELVDDGVFVAVRRISDGHHLDVTIAERDIISQAIDTRRAEFLSGRSLAREVAKNSGVALDSIAVGPWREPLWPNGIQGSISHSGELVAVALRVGDEPLGIDVEHVGAVQRDDMDVIVHRNDHRFINVDNPIDRAMTLSVKECVVKAAQHAGFIELCDMEVTARHDSWWTVRWNQRSFAIRSVTDLDTVPDHQLVWSSTVRFVG